MHDIPLKCVSIDIKISYKLPRVQVFPRIVTHMLESFCYGQRIWFRKLRRNPRHESIHEWHFYANTLTKLEELITNTLMCRVIF